MLSQYQASTDAEDGESGVDPRSDKELALAAREDPAVFGILYERHVSTIYRYVYYRVGNREDAEDLNARVFMRALKHIQRFDDRGVPFTAWLYRIAHNVVANFHRDNGRHPQVSLEDMTSREVHHHDDADHAIDLRLDQRRLALAFARLPEERQQLIALKFSQQLQNAEIGVIMRRSEGAIKSLYHRTLEQLRELMEAQP
ncbi:MAG: sigma-70 family RNA polymerase sigma factor [Thermoflexales bacterium]|nr:sigma-70 family RNA polymerase sigma factor [Thermoflexales bacterium]